MSKRSDIGNGDVCPLFPHHGPMLVLPHKAGDVPKQYCPHVDHDAHGGSGDGARPKSRAIWPLHGFDESVAAYTARIDRAIRESQPGDLPDLSDLEVN